MQSAKEQVRRFDSFDWLRPAGFDAGIEQVILVDTLDQQAKVGMRTRFVRFAPGARTAVPFIHDYDEEVYLVDGDQIRLAADAVEQLDVYQRGAYFIRPAGTYHGPFASQSGCVLLEIHSYPISLTDTDTP